MSLFRVYNKFDSMDSVVVTAQNSVEALVFAIRDGYLTNTLAVDRFSLVTLDLPSGYHVKSYDRHFKSYGRHVG